MKLIKITSKGEIDVRAFSLLGASSKRDDNTKIGYFGSGLKYSLAFLLRNKIPFRVFSGYRKVKFSTKLELFREQSFHRIFVDGKPTSLTTDMGVDWKQWYVIRELLSNAIDESEGKITVEDMEIKQCQPIEDNTTFYIKVDEGFQDMLDNWDLYFSEKRTDLIYHDKEMNQIYTGGDKMLVYRKGIRCQYLAVTKALFHYDMSWIKINESRIVADDWDFKYTLVIYLKAIKDETIIHRILYNINNYWEKTLCWNCSDSFSEKWLEQIGDKYLVPYERQGFWDDELKFLKGKYIVLPSVMIDSLKVCFGEKVKVIGDDEVKGANGEIKFVAQLDKRQQFFLDEAINFLEKSGYAIKYPMKVVQFSKVNVLGQAKDETIFLSEKLFTRGIRDIVSVIIEENEHNITQYSDESREFQTHFINLYVGALEEKSGKYL